ncbi:winged helix-turn-helix transcriptional regulator [Actinomadura atramentaria]|uniref:winged helix-turn-helix transcriptional regulator n=1 Tax=Actinomadura atramentaria TaxID=1990 RepID=UPI000365B181|nr:helix-turn-helix domain-containing protein [Actinomadura atramentaria]
MDEATPLPPGGENAIGVTLGLIGDEWALLVLRHAHQGVRRYADWRARLPVSDSVLAARLALLTRMGLLRREAYQERPTRHEYRLTRMGREIWPILVSIWAWEHRWVAGRDASLPRMRHRACGEPMEPALTCAACGAPVRPRDVDSRLGPSGGDGRSVPTAGTRRRSASGTGAAAAGLFPETMALVGNRWSVMLLGAAFLGAHRFGEFERMMGAPPAMVADRLRTFVGLGVLAEEPSAERADWTSYRLTDKGRAFFPVVMTGIAWGQRWFRAPEGPALVSAHRGCGAAFEPRLACDRCGGVLAEADVVVGPPEPARR